MGKGQGNKKNQNMKQNTIKKQQKKQSPQQVQKSKPGRPIKQQKIEKSCESQSDHIVEDKIYWFQDRVAVEIVKAVCVEGSIKFKIMGGKLAEQKKKQLDMINIDNFKFGEFKKERQNIYKKLNEEQEEIMEALNMKNEQFFIRDNQGKPCDARNNVYELLENVIHPDFMETLKQIRSSEVTDFYDSEEHQHLQNWALMKLWSQQGLELCETLSNPYQNENIEEEYLQEQATLKKCKEFYQKYSLPPQPLIANDSIKTLFENLKKDFKEEYEQYINGLILSLRQI